MVILSFGWVTLILFISIVAEVRLPSSYLALVVAGWIIAFMVAKTTTVPDDPRNPTPRLTKLPHREYHKWAIDLVQAMRNPAFHCIVGERFQMNPLLLMLITFSGAMHAGMFGWVTVLFLLQAALLAALVYIAHLPWPWNASIDSAIHLTIVGGALAVAFGLLGGIASGIYYRWVRAWPF